MFVFEAHKDLKLNPLFLIILEQFKYYKESSADDEHAAPTHHVQKNYRSVHPNFGRDRFDKYDHHANSEELQHVHIRDEHSLWEDEQGILFQWDCTSDKHLIYSYFKYDKKHYYYLIELYNTNAHIEYMKHIEYFIQEAKKYRLTITK